MKKLSQIQESRWTDIQKRSSGEEIRMEDNVNSMDVDRFVDYLVENYKDRVHYIDKDHYCKEYEMDIVVDPIKNIVIYGSYINDELARIMVVFRNTGVVKLDNGVAKLIETSPDNYRWIRLYSDKLELKLEKGDVTNQTYVDVIELFLNNEIYESRWTDIQKRSSGEEIRQEDNVNLLDIEDFFTYLENHYKVDNCGTDFEITDGNTIFIPFCTAGEKNIKLGALYYDQEDNVVYTHRSIPPYIPKLWNKMVEDFDLWMDEPDYERYIIINPKDTSRPVNNAYILEVIDYIIANLDSTVTQCIFKKTNESVWTDIQKRSSGEEIRQEDDVDIMDGEAFCDYLKSKYEIDNSQNRLPQPSEFLCIRRPSFCLVSIPLFAFDNDKTVNKIQDHASFEYYPDEDAIAFGCTSKKYRRIFLDLLSERFSDFDINKETQFFRGGITNKKVIEMIDFVIDNIKKPLIPLIVRK